MRIIVGLGNPGAEYANSRHNSGIMLVDKIFNVQYSIFKESYGWRRKKDIFVAEFPNLVLVKTAGVFMNESGGIIKTSPLTPLLNRDMSRASRAGEGELWIAHDDLDIHLGEYKIQRGKGPKVHYGVQSIENALGTRDFWRIRIGVDNRVVGNRIPGEEYVLQRFTTEELQTLDGVLERIINEITQTDN